MISARAPVLVATSVAARSLDIPEVKHVVNYDPQQHWGVRTSIGRTGHREQGTATAFFQADKDSRWLGVKVLSDVSSGKKMHDNFGSKWQVNLLQTMKKWLIKSDYYDMIAELISCILL